MDFDKSRDLDLLSDYIMRKINPLCGEAVKEKLGRSDVMEILGIDRTPRDPVGDPWNLESLMYADGLLNDVLKHIATTWGRLREHGGSTHPAVAPSHNEGEFD